MTYPINALYGSGFSYNPVSDGYADATTADTVQKMNALYAGPGGALRSLRNAIPQGSDGLSILNMARSGLGTAANWLQGTPEIGPDTLAPLGLGSMGTGVMNALTRASPDARIAKSLMESHPDAISLGQMWRSPSSVSVTSPGGDALVRGENRGALQRAASGGQYAITRPDPDVYGVADNVNVAGPAAVRDQKPSTSMPRERTPEEREAQFKEWQKESMAIRRGKEQMASGRFDVDGLSRIPADPRYSEFDSFLAGNKRDAWITVDGDLAIHARRTPGGIVLSNISTDRPGGGKFTSFLNRYEPQVSFQIENIQNARLPDYLRKRGYAVYGDTGIPQAVRPAGPSLLADNSRASAPGVVVNSLAENAKAARPEPGGLIPKTEAMGRGDIAETADLIRQSEDAFVKAYRQSVDENKHRYFDDWVEGEPIFDKDGNITDIPQTSARYEAASPYGASALEIVPAAAQAINAAARATGRDLYLSRALNTASHYGTLRTPSGKEHRVRVSDHARTSAQFDRPDFNIAPGSMTPEEFVRLLPTLRADNSLASAPGLAANSTQQSPDSGVLDILRKYGLSAE